MRHANFVALSGADTASVNGSQIDANQIIQASFQIVFADATATGTFKLQASNDICNDQYQPNTFTVTNWTDIPSATAAIASGASALLSLNNMAYRWVRAVYVRSSGGSTTVVVNANVLGQ